MWALLIVTVPLSGLEMASAVHASTYCCMVQQAIHADNSCNVYHATAT